MLDPTMLENRDGASRVSAPGATRVALRDLQPRAQGNSSRRRRGLRGLNG